MEKLYALYQELIEKNLRLKNDTCLIFVGNTSDSAIDTLHISECIEPVEKDMIVSAFRSVCDIVHVFVSESDFMREIIKYKHDYKNVLVYSMAQNLNGVGRRCLIPLLCQYYNIHNIGANFASSFLGGNKKLMFDMLLQNTELHFPLTIFITSTKEIKERVSLLDEGTYLIKPNDESASIGVSIIDVNSTTRNNIIEQLYRYAEDYPIFCIQKYLCGDEIEVPLLYYENDYFCPGVCKIVSKAPYMDYNVIAHEQYYFEEYNDALKESIIGQSTIVAQTLGFGALSRIDFIVYKDIPYIIDIGPNPTISEHSSTNFLFSRAFGNNKNAVYQLLLLTYMHSHGLLKPPLN